MKKQEIFTGIGCVSELERILKENGSKKFMLVCDSAFKFLPYHDFFSTLSVPHTVFGDFTPNPLYEDVCAGARLFNSEGCDYIVAVGGGSTIDVAKCIKLFCRMNLEENCLKQEYSTNGIPLAAIPTTAGTGSESTKFAVVYYAGEKQSVENADILPDYALLDASALRTLPLYQKKCTLLDALCQGIESMWSVNSNDESRTYSQKAIEAVIKNYQEYICGGTDEINATIMEAANFAGRAINISKTTAVHAMSYKLTSLFSLPHGHAVALCLPGLWRFMLANTSRCADVRGVDYLKSVFSNISAFMGCGSPAIAVERFEALLQELELFPPEEISPEELDLLASSVNTQRLKNNPIPLSYNELRDLYAAL